MKTLVNDNNHSVFLWEDNVVLNESQDRYEVGDPVELIISDCNSTNTTLYEDVTPPADWVGCKYFFDGTDWTKDTDFDDSAHVIGVEPQRDPNTGDWL
tara:strand:+ start:3185 stop:3478 length:294 start_codon:yes stop_codon:yes gene_type:complete